MRPTDATPPESIRRVVVEWPELPMGLNSLVAVWCVYYGTLGGWAIGREPSPEQECHNPLGSYLLVFLLAMVGVATLVSFLYTAFVVHAFAPPLLIWDDPVPTEPSPIDSWIVPTAFGGLGVLGGIVTLTAIEQILPARS